MRVDKFFSPADLAEIEKSIHEAESHTAGEIVPYAVSHSDHYEAALWKGATFGALLAPLLAALVHEMLDLWGGTAWLWILLAALAGGAIGYLALALIRPVRLWLAGRAVVDHHVHQRAAAAFLECEIFKTKKRTGILIFLSLFERRVVVMADSGINAHVEQAEWDSIVAGIISGIRSGQPGAALAAAIRRCGDQLAKHGVSIQPDDTDELADQLQMREE